ncbi:hypothetical protein NL676_010036 [Syzygium grande]|nr:hypothetical protein NL676_010036 [Syzygium grande]
MTSQVEQSDDRNSTGLMWCKAEGSQVNKELQKRSWDDGNVAGIRTGPWPFVLVSLIWAKDTKKDTQVVQWRQLAERYRRPMSVPGVAVKTGQDEDWDKMLGAHQDSRTRPDLMEFACWLLAWFDSPGGLGLGSPAHQDSTAGPDRRLCRESPSRFTIVSSAFKFCQISTNILSARREETDKYNPRYLRYVPLMASSVGIFSFVVALSIRKSAVKPANDICPVKFCGPRGPEIRFPFRASGFHPKRCGYPRFDLACNAHGQAILQLHSSQDFVVDRINYEKQYVVLKDPGNCLARRLQSTMFSSSVFVAQDYGSFTFANCSVDLSAFGIERYRFPVAPPAAISHEYNCECCPEVGCAGLQIVREERWEVRVEGLPGLRCGMLR